MLGLSRLKISLMTSAGVGGSFSPASLFASGEPGGWYDIDPAYLYQDSAGTTPVTAPGQTVGMVLDRSKGLVLGPELVTNGGFSSATGWTLGGSGASISGGKLNLSAATDNAGVFQSNAAYASAYLEITVVIDSISSGAVTVTVGVSTPGPANTVLYTLPGTYTRRVQNTGDNFLRVYADGASTTAVVDSVSVRPVVGNHLTQSTLSNRAIYGVEPVGGRRNLLTYTEQFDNAAWAKSVSTVTANSATSPDGTATADTIIPTTTNDFHYVGRAATVIAGASYVVSFYAKNSGYGFVRYYDGVSNNAVFNLSGSGSITDNSGGGGATITAVGNGWYRCTKAVVPASTSLNIFIYPQNVVGMVSYAGDGTSGVLIWGAQLEVGSTATAYQRVTDQWNVTEAGKTSVGYLQFDGSDDWLVSPTITPGIDKAQVFAGVRKLSDAVLGVIVESSTDVGANAGSISLTSRNAPAYALQSRGSVSPGNATTPSSYTAPITNVLTATGDIAGDNSTVRVNGAQVAQNVGDQGTGNFLAYPLYVGRRGGTSLPYNGRIYSLIVRFGANLDAATIAATEAYVNSKTGAY